MLVPERLRTKIMLAVTKAVATPSELATKARLLWPECQLRLRKMASASAKTDVKEMPDPSESKADVTNIPASLLESEENVPNITYLDESKEDLKNFLLTIMKSKSTFLQSSAL